MSASGRRTVRSCPIATSLFTGVFAVVPTKRRRFLWAAWWTAPPSADPFRKPDGSSGGARTREEARAAAEAAAGQTLVEIESRWAGAWVRVLRGDPPWPKRSAKRGATRGAAGEGETNVSNVVSAPRGSRPWAHALLGIEPGSGAVAIKRAFRALALRTHPDRGGDDAAFIDAKRAFDVAMAAATSAKRRRR